MQEFSSADSRHDFSLDGARYYLPAIDEDSVRVISTFADMERTERPTAMKRFLVENARDHRSAIARFFTGQKSARRAVESLSLVQASALFTAWAGMDRRSDSGESSSSPDVPSSTPVSSPQTSPSSTTATSEVPPSDD